MKKKDKKEYHAYVTNRRTRVMLFEGVVKATSSSRAMWNLREAFTKHHRYIFVQISEPVAKSSKKKHLQHKPKIWCKLFTN